MKFLIKENDARLLFALLGLRAAEMTVLPSRIIQEAKIIASSVSQQLMVGFIRCRFSSLLSLVTQLVLCTFICVALPCVTV